MNLHGGNQSSVMAFFARYVVDGYQIAPFRVCGLGVIVEQDCGAFYARKHSDCLRGMEAKSIVFNRASADGPALNQVLSSDTEHIAASQDAGDGFSCLLVLGMGAVNAAKENVGVG